MMMNAPCLVRTTRSPSGTTVLRFRTVKFACHMEDNPMILDVNDTTTIATTATPSSRITAHTHRPIDSKNDATDRMDRGEKRLA
ncbi:hypothetical protein ACKS0A_03550 [Histoplasma ohiense]